MLLYFRSVHASLLANVCAVALRRRETLSSRHEIENEVLSPPSHYCNPIFSSDNKVLGIITLYLPEGREIEEIWVELYLEPISFFKNGPM